MSTLRISDDLRLPEEAVTETFAILAKRGMGKTYTATVMAEEMLQAGHQVVVLDPIGVWWGLRSSADGKQAGLPIVVMGGDHADVPLEPGAGELVADLVVDEGLSVVLDMSQLRKGQQATFVTAFAERLYHRNRRALHLMVDEADAFAPQRTPRGHERLLGAMEDLVRRGRARGIGVTLISQRSAVLNKDVLTQAEVLVAMRMTAPQDRAAIDEWVKLHGDQEKRAQLMADLASLPVGEAVVWSPGWLDLFKRIRVRRRLTFDSSATPKVGEKRVEPRARADVDLDALRARMADTIERARADDPKELRRRIADLERQLREALASTPEPVVERVEVPVLDPQLVARLEEALDPIFGLTEGIQKACDAVGVQLRQAQEGSDGRQDVPRAGQPGRGARPVAAPRAEERARPPSRRDPGRPPVPRAETAAGDADLGLGERRILAAACQSTGGVTREHLTVATGYKRSSRDTYIRRLTAAGFVTTEGGTVVATQAGVDELGDDYERLPTGAALRDYWLGRLPAGESRILAELVDAYPDTVARDDLSDRLGYKRSSRDTYLRRLAVRELVDTTPDGVRAADDLFAGPAP